MIEPLSFHQARVDRGKFGSKDISNLKWSGVIRRYFLGILCGSCLIVNCNCFDDEKTYNNHNALIRHIERYHKPDPQGVRIYAKLPEDNN